MEPLTRALHTAAFARHIRFRRGKTMRLTARRITKYEVIDEGESWAVVALDVLGNRYLICDYDDALKAKMRAVYLNRKSANIEITSTRSAILRASVRRRINRH
jgi:hypothetical protein